jgi:hypothetical protein
MCTVLLPPGVNPIAVNRFIIKHPDRLGGSFSRVNRPEREVKHSRPSNADVTNEWGYTSTPLIRLHGVDNEDFTIYS